MLTISLIVALIGGCVFVERLRSIQKHSKSHLAFMYFQRDVMSLLRSSDLNLSHSDYKRVRKLLLASNGLLEVYSCQRPSSFHTEFLFGFLNTRFPKKAYEYDVMVNSLKPRSEKVVELQSKFVQLIEWTVFYNTPLYTLAFYVLASLPIAIALKTTRGFKGWYREVLVTYTKNRINDRLGHIYATS